MSFEKELKKLFDEAIDIHDTIWYSNTETLYEAILRIYDNDN